MVAFKNKIYFGSLLYTEGFPNLERYRHLSFFSYSHRYYSYGNSNTLRNICQTGNWGLSPLSDPK